MDNFGITKETAGQISKFMVSADRYDDPGCAWHTWVDPRPQGSLPQPFEKGNQEVPETVNWWRPMTKIAPSVGRILNFQS